MPRIFVCTKCRKTATDQMLLSCEACSTQVGTVTIDEVSDKKFEMLKREEHGKKTLLIFLIIMMFGLVLSQILIQKG